MANTDFGVLLQAELDKSGINTELKKVQEIVRKYHLELTPDLQTASLKNQFKSVCQQMANDFNKTFNTNVSGNDIFKVYENKAKQLKQTIEQVNKIQLLSTGGIKNDYATQIAKLEGNFRSLGLAQDTINIKTQNVKNTLGVLRAEFAKPLEERNFQLIQVENDRMQRELIESTNEIIRLQSAMKGMATEQQRLNLANTIEAWNQKNTRATKQVREENERYVASLRDLSQTMTKIEFGKIQTGFKNAENSMRGLNKLGLALKDQWTQAVNSFKVWLSASTLVMLLINKVREMPRAVKELDTALVDLKKTTTMTAKQLEDFYYSSNDIAKQMGVATKEIINQAAAWSRLN